MYLRAPQTIYVNMSIFLLSISFSKLLLITVPTSYPYPHKTEVEDRGPEEIHARKKPRWAKMDLRWTWCRSPIPLYEDFWPGFPLAISIWSWTWTRVFLKTKTKKPYRSSLAAPSMIKPHCLSLARTTRHSSFPFRTAHTMTTFTTPSFSVLPAEILIHNPCS